MDREIFQMSLSVEAVSAYILIDELTASGVRPIGASEVAAVWNSTEEALGQALDELTRRQVLARNGGEITLLPQKRWF